MEEAASSLREAYWDAPPALPPGLSLERREPLAVTRPGRGGTSVYDILELVTPAGRLPLIAAYRTRLLAGQIPELEQRLAALGQQRSERRSAATGRVAAAPLPALITDRAKPTVADACRRAGVALFDQRGTVLVSAGGVFIFVEGKGAVDRPWRGRLFSGKASRVVRFLLTKAAFEPVVVPRTAQAIASACDLSYVYAYGVLTKLEQDGFVERRSARTGFRLRDPLGLLRAWIASGERTALAVEGFNAPATTKEALGGAAKRLYDENGDQLLFSLASALEPEDRHVAGLAHGAYFTSELAPLIEALGLRRKTPHNFLVLRPDPLVWTPAGGLLLASEGQPAEGPPRVALPQLAADFAALPGRGREQADFLVGVYGKALPYRVEEDE